MCINLNLLRTSCTHAVMQHNTYKCKRANKIFKIYNNVDVSLYYMTPPPNPHPQPETKLHVNILHRYDCHVLCMHRLDIVDCFVNRIVLFSSWGNTFPLNTVAARANSGSRSRLAPCPSGIQQWSFGSRRSVLGSTNTHTPVQRNSSLNTAILNKPGLLEVGDNLQSVF